MAAGAWTTCPACRGVRLNEFARAVRLQGVTPGDIASLPAVAAAELVKGWRFEREEALIARDVVAEITQRLNFLQRVGLGYHYLDRSATTLSGGETQRIRLASQLGSHLRGVLYVLDEPTIGLHPRDVRLLIDVLHRLADQGNTVIVIEHNTEIMAEADYVIDMGPGPGDAGGTIVAEGTPEQIAGKESPTAEYIRRELNGVS